MQAPLRAADCGPRQDGGRDGRSVERHKPGLFRLLRCLGLAAAYHRSEGDFVYYRDGCGRDVEVLDLVGGYGSLLLGHAHPALRSEACEFFRNRIPAQVQGSVHPLAERLAGELSRRAEGDYSVVFGNSGAEAVEAAMKHAMLETGGRTFIALHGAFHGKTLGAVQLTANAACRRPFRIRGLNVVRVRRDDVEQLETAFTRAGGIAGFVFEPIQGEGGVRPLSSGFLRRAAELCDRHRVPLIADECQTGLGRTGSFLASQALGVRPDYVILSKALGGGLAKISAVLIDRRRYHESFDLLHSSTYADDGFSCAVALKVLELLDGPMVRLCGEKGARLLTALRSLADEYPEAVAEVRGAGLMAGVELRRPTAGRHVLLRYLAAHRQLGLLVTGYLLREHAIRVAPTLSDPLTLRIEPSVLITDESIERLLAALRDVCGRLGRGDVVGLMRHLCREDVPPPSSESACVVPSPARIVTYRPARFRRQQARSVSRRVAWLFHLIDAHDLGHLDAAFARLPPAARERYAERLAPFAEPVVMAAVDVHSNHGGPVRLYPILLPVTSRWLKQRVSARRFRPLRRLVQRGIDVAHSLGCSLVSLGQFTSIVTRNGRGLATHDMGLTTGNSYTVALVRQALQRAHDERGRDPADCTLAVVGAGGNIGRACAELIGPGYRQILLVGNGRSESPAHVNGSANETAASWSGDLAAVRSADVVIAAVNCVDAPLRPEHIDPRAIVCDVSIPRAIAPETERLRPQASILPGGIARLPMGEELGIPGFPLPAGSVYGCLAEAILLGLEGVRDASFTGAVSAANVHWLETVARLHGFESWHGLPARDRPEPTDNTERLSVSPRAGSPCHDGERSRPSTQEAGDVRFE